MNGPREESYCCVSKCSISVIEHVLVFEARAAAQFSKYLCLSTYELTHAWIMRAHLHTSAHCVQLHVCLQIIIQQSLISPLKWLKYYWNYYFLPTVLEIWRLIWLIVFTSYARIRIKTRVPPERGRSSWQLGQVLQVGRWPRWRRGKGIISSSWLRSWLGITISMMMHVVVASLFFRHSWCSSFSTASFFVVDKIRHSSSQTTIIRIIWNTHRD